MISSYILVLSAILNNFGEAWTPDTANVPVAPTEKPPTPPEQPAKSKLHIPGPPHLFPQLDKNTVLQGIVKGGPERNYPDSIPPQLSCPSEFRLEGRACVRIDHMEQNARCPPNYVAEGARCVLVRKTQAKIACPEGTIQKNGKCEIFEVVPPERSCDHGFELIDSVCVKKAEKLGKTKCPEGFKPGKDGCVSSKRVQPELKCPHRFELLANKKCESWVYEKVIKECPSGYIVSGEECVRETRQPAVITCPKGGMKAPDQDVCYYETVVKPHTHCVQGSTKGTKCEFVIRQPVVHKCPSGFEQAEHNHQRCIKIIEEKPIPTCESGFKLENNECVRVFIQKPDLTCPEGTLSRNGNCVVNHTSKGEFGCPKGWVLDHDGMCVSTSRKPAIERCPKGYKPTFYNECEMVVSIPPEAWCPEGYLPHNGACESIEIVQPQLLCDSSEELSNGGKCILKETKAPHVNCRVGFQLEKGLGDCTRMAQVPGVPYCDEGLISDMECEIRQETRPQFECPKGYIGIDGYCERTEILEARLECPRKYKLKNGLCVKA